MSAPEFLCQLMGINPKNFSKDENTLLEAEFFTQLYEKLQIYFREKYRNYFYLMELGINKENEMREDNLVYCVVNDILASKEYTLDGIAYYTGMPEEVIYEAAMGSNKAPSANLLRKVIELHRTVRPQLYIDIMEKVAMEYLSLIKEKGLA